MPILAADMPQTRIHRLYFAMRKTPSRKGTNGRLRLRAAGLDLEALKSTCSAMRSRSVTAAAVMMIFFSTTLSVLFGRSVSLTNRSRSKQHSSQTPTVRHDCATLITDVVLAALLNTIGC